MYNSDSFIVSQPNVEEMESHNHVTYVVSKEHKIRGAYNICFELKMALFFVSLMIYITVLTM